MAYSLSQPQPWDTYLTEHRQFIYPFEGMICNYPPAYLAPEQSRYHNLGMNGYREVPSELKKTKAGRYLSLTKTYPDKRPGMVGDWGPKQEGDEQTLAHGVYPLDMDILQFNADNNYRFTNQLSHIRSDNYQMLPLAQPQRMSPKSAAVLAAGINTCNPNICNPYNPNCAPHY